MFCFLGFLLFYPEQSICYRGWLGHGAPELDLTLASFIERFDSVSVHCTDSAIVALCTGDRCVQKLFKCIVHPAEVVDDGLKIDEIINPEWQEVKHHCLLSAGETRGSEETTVASNQAITNECTNKWQLACNGDLVVLWNSG